MAIAPRRKKQKQSRFVLFVGDEGGILVYLQGKRVVRRLFAANPDPANTRAMQEALAGDPSASVRILVDMMDQSFVRQSLPPVTSFSVNKLIKRRLERDFAAEDIKGALLLGREKEGRRDWNFMLISLANSPTLQKWIDLAIERPNPFQGIYLMPVEAESYMKSMVTGLKTESDSEWQLLVSHNKVGGFRQVVFRNKRLVFTRMAQPIGESMPEVIAGNIEQEILNTTEYLKRMGYIEATGLDTYIIVSGAIKDAIDATKIKAANTHLLTPYETAFALGLEQAAQPEDHFGDVVISTFFGFQRKPVLRLQTKYTQKLHTLATGIQAIRYAGMGIAAMLVLYTASTLLDLQPVRSDIASLETQKKGITQELDETRAEAKKLPHDIDRITDVVSLHETFSKETFKPIWFVKRFADLLEDGVLVTSIQWNLADAMKIVGDQDGRQIDVQVTLAIERKKEDSEAFAKRAEAFLKRIEADFTGYSVTYTDLPGVVREGDAFRATFTPEGQQVEAAGVELDKPVSVTVSIKGPIPPTPGGT